MKTHKDWQKSNLDLEEYLLYPCRIDEELYLYILEVVVPNYHNNQIAQGGDAIYTDSNGIQTYMTVIDTQGMYFYLGVLPEFKTEPFCITAM